MDWQGIGVVCSVVLAVGGGLGGILLRHGARLAGIGAVVDRMEKRIDTNGGIPTRCALQDARLEEMDRKLDGLESAMTQLFDLPMNSE